MQRKILLKVLSFVIIMSIIITAGTGCVLLPAEEEPLAPPLVPPAVVEYVTEIASKGDLKKTLTMSGSFRSTYEILLIFKDRGGYIQGIYVKKGQEVKAGDPIMDLDIDKLIKDKEQAYYTYKIAKLQYEATSSTNYYSKEIAKLQKSRAYSAYEEAVQELEKAQMFSPIDGEITYMTSGRIGEWISAGSTVVKIADPTQLYLMVQGDKTNEFNKDDKVVVTINGKEFGDTEYAGIVIQSPYDKVKDIAIDYEEPTVIIEVEDLPMDLISINDEAKVVLTQASREDVIVLKRSLVQNYNGRTYVHILKDGIKTERDVLLGLQAQTQVEIVEGLEEGEVIIIR